MKIAGVNAYLFVTIWILFAIIGYLFLVDAPRLERKRRLQKKKIS